MVSDAGDSGAAQADMRKSALLTQKEGR